MQLDREQWGLVALGMLTGVSLLVSITGRVPVWPRSVKMAFYGALAGLLSGGLVSNLTLPMGASGWQLSLMASDTVVCAVAGAFCLKALQSQWIGAIHVVLSAACALVTFH